MNVQLKQVNKLEGRWGAQLKQLPGEKTSSAGPTQKCCEETRGPFSVEEPDRRTEQSARSEWCQIPKENAPTFLKEDKPAGGPRPEKPSRSKRGSCFSGKKSQVHTSFKPSLIRKESTSRAAAKRFLAIYRAFHPDRNHATVPGGNARCLDLTSKARREIRGRKPDRNSVCVFGENGIDVMHRCGRSGGKHHL